MSETMETPEIIWGHQLLIYHQIRHRKETRICLELFEDLNSRYNPSIVFELDNVASMRPKHSEFSMFFHPGYSIILPRYPLRWIGIRPMGLEHGTTHRLVFCPRRNRIAF
jgi:hypothetical protein